MIRYILCLLLCMHIACLTQEKPFACLMQEKPCVVIITSYNNMRWYEKNLDSVRIQQYSNYRVIYVDDCSTDGTADAVEAYVQQWRLQDRVTVIRNTVRRGQLYNLYTAIHTCPNDVIVLTLDGDDWFAHDGVLSLINSAYDESILMTYGQFREYPKGKLGFCKKVPDVVKVHAAYRYYEWVTSHLRTFYAGLFKEIPIGCFIKGDDFMRSACDHAFMFPLLELAGGRARFVDEVVYIYNMANSNSVCKTNLLQQLTNAHWIRGRVPLQQLNYDPRVQYKTERCLVHNIHFSAVSIELCEEYLRSLCVACINPADVTVLCDATSVETGTAYKTLCAAYGVACCVINDSCTCTYQVHTVCEQLSNDSFLLLTSDGCMWTHSCNLHSGAQLLRQTKALGYSYAQCDAGDTVDIMPTLISLHNGECVWKYAENEGAWHMPYSAHAVLYCVAIICPIFNRIHAQSVHEYVQALSTIPSLYPDNVGAGNKHALCEYKTINYLGDNLYG